MWRHSRHRSDSFESVLLGDSLNERHDYVVPKPEMRCIKEMLSESTCVFFTDESYAVADGIDRREKNNLLDLCDRLLDMNPIMRPTTQMVYDTSRE